MMIPDLGKGMTQAVNLGVPALHRVPRLRRILRRSCRRSPASKRNDKSWFKEGARAMKTFGKVRPRERSAPGHCPAPSAGVKCAETRLPLDQQRPAVTSLRDRVIREIDPSVAATVSPEVLRRQIEEIIHGIANKERLELSGREQARLQTTLPTT